MQFNTSDGVIYEHVESINPAKPATIGVAIDVPDLNP